MQGKKPDPKPAPPKPEQEKFVSYRSNVIASYDRGSNRADIDEILKEISPDSDILNSLIDFDKKIDMLAKRKRFDLQELFIRPARKIKKLLRVHVVNECVQGAHRLKLKGYLFPLKKETKDLKFTSFFKQISLRFSNQSYNNYTWKKTQPAGPEKDGIVLSLSSTDKTNVEISFSLLNNPPKFKIDPYLQKIVKMEIGTRNGILEAIWQYIKLNKLQDLQNKETINTDQNMKNAFKCQKIPFSSINGRIRELLTPADPIIISLTLSGDRTQEKIFDFVVQVQAKPKTEVMPFLSQRADEKNDKTADNPYFYLSQKIKKIDKAIQEQTEKMRRHVFKREVYKNFSQETIQKILVEQNQLLRDLADTQKRDNVSRLEFLLDNQDEVEKEIKNYLESLNSNRQPQP